VLFIVLQPVVKKLAIKTNAKSLINLTFNPAPARLYRVVLLYRVGAGVFVAGKYIQPFNNGKAY
jgi:hypothetical protein